MEIHQTKSEEKCSFLHAFLTSATSFRIKLLFFFFELVICLFDFSVIEKKKNKKNIMSPKTQAEHLPFLKERRPLHGTGPRDRAEK